MGKRGVPTEGVALVKAYPRLVELIERHRSQELSGEVVAQLRRVHVPSQILAGTPNHFQFHAYPLPIPSYEERQKLPVFREQTVTVVGNNWSVSLDLSVFGVVNWFYVDGIPELYHALEPYLPMGE